MIFPLVSGGFERACGKKKFAAFLTLFFILYFVPSALAGIIIPPELATVRDRSEGKNGKTVVIIEEAHVQYPAQKALANILKDLIENESFRYVFVEGGWGDVSLTKLRSLTNFSRREEVAEQYLREGKISGEEYLDLATDLDIRLWGVEDPKLYEANMKVFLPYSEVQAGLLAALEKLHIQVQALRLKMLTPKMNEILDARQAFDDQKSSLLDYALFLRKRLPEVSARYPQIVSLSAFSGKDGSYDPDKLGPEKEAAVRFLSKHLTKPEIDEILSLEGPKTLEGERLFFDVLLKKTASFQEAREELSLKNLRSYTDILEKTVGMDTSRLMEELEKAGFEALSAQKPSKEERTLLGILQGMRTLKKLFDLRLTLGEFRNGSLDLTGVGEWNAFLGERCSSYGLSYQPFEDAAFAKAIPEAMTFYRTAVAREESMLVNAVAKMEALGIDRMAFVMGGFHSRVIFQALKDRGYTVLLVSPRFKPEDVRIAQEHYLNILKYKWTGNAKSEYRMPNIETNSNVPNLNALGDKVSNFKN